MSDFVRRAFIEEKELVGARWWQEHLASVVGRRDSLRALGWLAVGLLGAGAAARLLEAVASSRRATGASELHVTKDAIDLQRASGWDVGREGATLAIDSPSLVDVNGGTPGDAELEALATRLAPSEERLAPYYVPTLFQSVAPGAASSANLRAALKPSRSTEMDRALAQGAALASLFDGLPPETAVLVDLPGPLAVAFAAGMSGAFEPVFTFDNWPHPFGVVKSQDTLAAALYYAPMLADTARSRRAGAPPVFVLDANRLATYTDAQAEFDNRYLAKLPTAANFAELGVRHVLYVTDGRYEELDDLNDDFVALAAAGLAPRLVDRREFTTAGDAHPELAVIGEADAGRAPPDAGYTYAPRPTYTTTRYWYGGYPSTHFWFWHTYGWYSPPSVRYASPPRAVSPAASYAPARRATIFSGAGGRVRPGGFGRVAVTTTPSGEVTSTPLGRSGSFGRAGSGGGGGTG